MQDTSTTLRGRIGSDPIMKYVKGNTCVTTFRLAITRWRFASDAPVGHASYVEDGAYWYTIESWDGLAQNVFRSCRKGDPVVVVARPVPNGWIDANGQVRSAIVYRASAVGHDLSRGTARFEKNGSHSLTQAAGGTVADPFSTRPEQLPAEPHEQDGAGHEDGYHGGCDDVDDSDAISGEESGSERDAASAAATGSCARAAADGGGACSPDGQVAANGPCGEEPSLTSDAKAMHVHNEDTKETHGSKSTGGRFDYSAVKAPTGRGAKRR